MHRPFAAKSGPSVASVTVLGADCQDSGIGVVVARRPLTLLVPSHLIALLEQGEATAVLVNGVEYPTARILPTPALQQDHLSVLQFKRKPHHGLASAALPRQQLRFSSGQSVQLRRSDPPSDVAGTIVDVRERGDGVSLLTDIEVKSGDSGSPLLVSGQLVGVCQGMTQADGVGTAVAVPLSPAGLTELRKLRRRTRLTIVGALLGAILCVALAFSAFAWHSSRSFSLASVEIAEDGSMITARNAQRLTLHASWTRSFRTPIRTSQAFSTTSGGTFDRVAIGTLCQDGHNGQLVTLDSLGRERWRYEIPDGECVYSTQTKSFNGFVPVAVYPADLDVDGRNELLVVFVHDPFYPCKLVVFSSSGEILAEYWHPGYIRTISVGQVGNESTPLVVVSASNNRIRTDWWNPQTLFAFSGLDISGQAPPYSGGRGDPRALVPANELWYWVILNVDPEMQRAKCKSFAIGDFDGDGLHEIRAPLTDGRFFYLDEGGQILAVDLGDKYLKEFPDTPPPPLVAIREYIDTVVVPFHGQPWAPD